MRLPKMNIEKERNPLRYHFKYLYFVSRETKNKFGTERGTSGDFYL